MLKQVIRLEKIYNSILYWVRKNPTREKSIIVICKVLPYITAISYIGIIIHTILYVRSSLILIIGIPVSIFILVTVLRKIWNRPRPYETFYIHPLFHNKQGESTPSRHTASAFAIALTGCIISPCIGYPLLCIATIIGLSRFIAGVHYLSDIILAILISIIIYYLFIMFIVI